MVNAMKLTAPIGASPRGDILARGRIQSRYVYCDGEHGLLLTTPEITAAHAEAIERADAEFALVIEEPAILLCAGSAIRSPGRPPRSAGTPCRAACASVAPAPHSPEELRALLQVTLAESATLRPRAVRERHALARLHPLLHEAIRDQARKNLDPKEHERVLSRLRLRHPTVESLVA